MLTFELRLANSLFNHAISGLSYYDTNGGPQTFEANQTLRLVQSFGYSVAGDTTYGDNRFGSFSVSAAIGAVPEPAT